MSDPAADHFSMRLCTPSDIGVVHEILCEAARWLEETGRPLSRSIDFSEANIAGDIARYALASVDGRAAGTLRLQPEDALFWPDLPEPGAEYVHRVAVRRAFAGRGVAHRMLAWAADHARALGRTRLRLACDASRPKLRRIYEEFGFACRGERQVGPYLAARYEYKL